LYSGFICFYFYFCYYYFLFFFSLCFAFGWGSPQNSSDTFFFDNTQLTLCPTCLNLRLTSSFFFCFPFFLYCFTAFMSLGLWTGFWSAKWLSQPASPANLQPFGMVNSPLNSRQVVVNLNAVCRVILAERVLRGLVVLRTKELRHNNKR